MRVLMITGDKGFGPGHPRYELQRTVLDDLAVVYWGRGNIWPKIPEGTFDVVTSQDPFWRGLFAVWAARRIGAKLNIQVHTDLVTQSFLKHVLARIVLRHADSIRVVSQKIKDQISASQVRAPVQILPIFIDTEVFRNIVRIPHDQKTILWVGRFEQEKDPIFALDILKQVRQRTDAKLIMLGKGSLAGELKEKAKDLPVEFPGWQNPLRYYAQADMLLVTSRYEGFGAAMVEALLAGIPVVAPDVGVAREAGALVVPRGELAEAAIKTLESTTRAELQLSLLSQEAWVCAWKESL